MFMSAVHERWTGMIRGMEPASNVREGFYRTQPLDVPCEGYEEIRVSLCIAQEGNQFGIPPGFYVATNVSLAGIATPEIRGAISTLVIETLRGKTTEHDGLDFDSAARFSAVFIDMETGGVVLRLMPYSKEEYRADAREAENGNKRIHYQGPPIPFQ